MKLRQLFIAAVFSASVIGAAPSLFAQRGRPVSAPSDDQTKPAATDTNVKTPAATTKPAADAGSGAAGVSMPAARPFKAKYEGGVLGYKGGLDGSLTFDDMNERLVFRNKFDKEILSLPYRAIASAYSDTQSKRPRAASVIGNASILTLPALLIKRKHRYLTMQYKDPDTEASGTTSFKFGDKDELAEALTVVVNRAKLRQRGDVYVKRRETSSANQ